ncbi:TetR/AcrR family transcriptional regulator [Actinomadura atramentaria]|uniref:TetR/AcrR family transcriptional regulator n=1 Tax=Actinomadura atramentaria TaxID=1990 RepID=UPI0003690CE2|nr:TetR/AcrR family transcriptional regulator [Actinomadura atramentaria]
MPDDRVDGAAPGDVERLPSGRHRLSRAFVADHQVRRILAAVVEVAGADGFGQLTVDAIIARAGVSRATFYVHFRNKEDAFLRAYDALFTRMMERVVEAYRGRPDALGRLRGGIGALLEFLAEDPAAARTWVVESMAAGPAAAVRRDEALAALSTIVADNMRELYPHYPDPDLTAETIVGGIYQVVYTRIQRGEAAALPELLPGLLNAFASPDLDRWGPGAAAGA